MQYTEEELYAIIVNPRQVGGDPYKLFAALVLDALKEYLTSEDEDEGLMLWGNEISECDFNTILNNCIEDFTAAIQEGCRIEIGLSPFTIRNSQNVQVEKLKTIFQFRKNQVGNLIIEKGRIINVNTIKQPTTIAEQRQHTSENRAMAIKIYYQGRNDNGWLTLTDMERAVYTWIIYYQKRKDNLPANAYQAWYSKYNEYFGLPLATISSCLQNNLNEPQNAFSFAADKVRSYNERHKQTSKLETVDYDMAADYWYKRFI